MLTENWEICLSLGLDLMHGVTFSLLGVELKSFACINSRSHSKRACVIRLLYLSNHLKTELLFRNSDTWLLLRCISNRNKWLLNRKARINLIAVFSHFRTGSKLGVQPLSPNKLLIASKGRDQIDFLCTDLCLSRFFFSLNVRFKLNARKLLLSYQWNFWSC